MTNADLSAAVKRTAVCTCTTLLLLAGCAAFLSTEEKARRSLETQKALIPEHIPDRVRYGDFAYAEERIRYHQDGYDADHATEPAFLSVLDVIFDTSDPVLEGHYQEWVQQAPDSFAASLARGIFYVSRGRRARGTYAADQTSKEQWAQMRYYFAKGRQDLERTLELRPGAVHAYAYLIEITKGTNEHERRDAYRNAALAIAPDNALVRDAYFSAITPRWGGSIAQMEAFLADTLPYTETAPHLRYLRGRVTYEQGEMKWIFEESPDYAAALAYYDQALSHGSCWYYSLSKGRVLTGLGRYPEAVASFEDAIRLRPSYELSHEFLVEVNDLTSGGVPIFIFPPSFRRSSAG